MQNFKIQLQVYQLNSQKLHKNCYYTFGIAAGGQSKILVQKKSINKQNIVDFNGLKLSIVAPIKHFKDSNNNAKIIVYQIQKYKQQKIFGIYEFVIHQQNISHDRVYLKQCSDVKAVIFFSYKFQSCQLIDIANNKNKHYNDKQKLSNKPSISQFKLNQNSLKVNSIIYHTDDLKTSQYKHSLIDIVKQNTKQNKEIKKQSTNLVFSQVGEDIIVNIQKSKKINALRQSQKKKLYELIKSRSSINSREQLLYNDNLLQNYIYLKEGNNKIQNLQIFKQRKLNIIPKVIQQKYQFGRKENIKIYNEVVNLKIHQKQRRQYKSQHKIASSSFLDTIPIKQQKYYRVALTSRSKQDKSFTSQTFVNTSKNIECSYQLVSEKIDHAKLSTLFNIKKQMISSKNIFTNLHKANERLLHIQKKLNLKIQIAEQVINQKQVLLGKKIQTLIVDSLQPQKYQLNKKSFKQQLEKTIKQRDNYKLNFQKMQTKVKIQQQIIKGYKSVLYDTENQTKKYQEKPQEQPTKSEQKKNIRTPNKKVSILHQKDNVSHRLSVSTSKKFKQLFDGMDQSQFKNMLQSTKLNYQKQYSFQSFKPNNHRNTINQSSQLYPILLGRNTISVTYQKSFQKSKVNQSQTKYGFKIC